MSAPPTLKRVAYVSTASKGFTRDGIYRLMRESIQRNQRCGITGLLLHWEPQFLQILEGPEGPVEETLARIRKDPRHHRFHLLGEQSATKRQFTDLGMGYLDFRPVQRRGDEVSREIEAAFDGAQKTGEEMDKLLAHLVSLRTEVKNFSGSMI